MALLDKKLNKNLELAPVETRDEASILIKAILKPLRGPMRSFESISAPEVGIKKKIACIHSEGSEITLINPEIISFGDKCISFGEQCYSFPYVYLNCLRYNYVEIENGLPNNRKILKFEGKSAFLAQHAISHLVYSYAKPITLALIREGGKILDQDYCPCASKKKYFECCKYKEVF